MFSLKKQKNNIVKWYDGAAEKYDSLDEANFNKEMKSINKLLDIKKGEKLLDVGTGTGNYLILAAKKGAICYGIDISKKMVKIAKDKIKKLDLQNVKEIKVGDAQSLQYNDNFFDWILCIGMLEYYPLEIVEKILKEFKRVLKSNGKVIIDFPNFKNTKAYEFQKKSESVNTNVFIYQKGIIEKTLESVDFNILSTKKAGIELQFFVKVKKV